MSHLPPFPEIPPVYHHRVLFVYVFGMLLGVVLGASLSGQPRPRTSSDVILACLQKQGMPVYAVGPDGPPPVGKPLTAEMFTVICVEEK